MSKKEPVCVICEGKGFIPLLPTDPRYLEIVKGLGDLAETYIFEDRCECTIQKRFRKWVGEPIYRAKILETSMLEGREEEDLFITASRMDFLANLRLILSKKDFSWSWKITTDSELRDVFVGNDSDYNSVSSLIKGSSLLIIQLAVLSYKNVAMAGTVLEALRIRQFDGKPTWVVNPHTNPFKEGHLAWSHELDFFINESFEKVVIPDTVREVSAPKVSSNSITTFQSVNKISF